MVFTVWGGGIQGMLTIGLEYTTHNSLIVLTNKRYILKFILKTRFNFINSNALYLMPLFTLCSPVDFSIAGQYVIKFHIL